jgi:hypothetical protein
MSKLSRWKTVCFAIAAATLSLLAANVRADSFSDQAAKLDIVGVHLGMTLAQVKSVLDQYRKGMNWLDGKLNIQNGQFVVVANTGWNPSANPANSTGEKIAVLFSIASADHRVVAVTRDVGFVQSQAPLVQTVINSLMEKYGKPSDQSPYDSSVQGFLWAWDNDGRQISTPNLMSICRVEDNFNLLTNPLGGIGGVGIAAIQKANSECAIALSATVYSYDKNKIATLLKIKLVDLHDGLQAAIVADGRAKQVEEAKKEAALKKLGAK